MNELLPQRYHNSILSSKYGHFWLHKIKWCKVKLISLKIRYTVIVRFSTEHRLESICKLLCSAFIHVLHGVFWNQGCKFVYNMFALKTLWMYNVICLCLYSLLNCPNYEHVVHLHDFLKYIFLHFRCDIGKVCIN